MPENCSCEHGMLPSYSTSLDNNTTEEVIDWSRFVKASLVINAALLVCTIGVLACVIQRGTSIKAWNLSTDKGKLYIAFATTIVCTIPRLILDITCYQLRETVVTFDKCELLFDLSNGCGTISLSATYFFLWLRQWITYRHATIQRITPKWIYLLSWITLAVSITASVFFICVLVIPPSYEFNGLFCVTIKTNASTSVLNWIVTARTYLVGCWLLLIQIIFLLLFTYPMIRTRKNLRTATNREKQNDVIVETVRRSFQSVIVAVVSDCVSLIILGTIPWRAPLLISNAVYNTAIYINLCCIVHTFRYPLDIVFVCCKKRTEEQEDTTIRVGQSSHEGYLSTAT